MRREKPKSITFIYPNVEDISDVSFDDVVGKLPSPIQYAFPVDLTSYLNVLR